MDFAWGDLARLAPRGSCTGAVGVELGCPGACAAAGSLLSVSLGLPQGTAHGYGSRLEVGEADVLAGDRIVLDPSKLTVAGEEEDGEREWRAALAAGVVDGRSVGREVVSVEQGVAVLAFARGELQNL